MPFFDAVRVKFQLLSGDGIHEWVDHLIEGVEKEGNVDNESPAEALRVVILEDVQNLYRHVTGCKHSTKFLEGEIDHLERGRERGGFGLFSIVYHKRHGPKVRRCEKRRRKESAWEHQLSTKPHQVRRSLERPHHLMDLSIASFGVLSTGEHIQCWTILGIVTEQDLFPRDELKRVWSSIVRVERMRKERAPPVRDTRGCEYTHQTLVSISGWTRAAR